MTGSDGGAVVGWLNDRDVLRVDHRHEPPPRREHAQCARDLVRGELPARALRDRCHRDLRARAA